MAPQAFQFSPFDRRQMSSLATDRNAPGRSAASPGVGNSAGRTLFPEIARHSGDDAPGEPSDLSAPGRHPHVHGEQHDDATSQAAVTAVSGRLVSDTDARRMAPAVSVADDLGSLAGRLERGARDAGRVARNLDILAARLSAPVGLCESYSHQGLTYAVNEHAEHAQLLADAHAVVVRLSAYPEIFEVLAALEAGAEVIVSADADDAPPLSHAAGNRSAGTDAVSGEHYPTSLPHKLWSGIIDFISAGHRKSSSPAHHVCPSVREQITTDVTACASKNCGYRNQGRRA